MEKIKTLKQAQHLADIMYKNNITIQLWDTIKSNRIMYIENNNIYYIDTVNGNTYKDIYDINTVIYALWENRKYINNSKQLLDI